jgi:(E)-4-hydroxy-3-methylbut-2-enyl-diphosphate synthase
MVCSSSCATITSPVREAPGSGENPVAPVYVDGERRVTLKGETIAEDFQRIVEQYVHNRYAAPQPVRSASEDIGVQP